MKRNNSRKMMLLKSTFIGATIGYAFLHPFGMIVHQMFRLQVDGDFHVNLDQLIETYFVTFSFAHLPQALSYAVLAGLVGYLLGRVLNAYKVIAEDNKKLSIIGKNTATIVHDLNNPLNAIVLCVSLLAKQIEGEKQKKRCDAITAQVMRFSRMIENITLVAVGNSPINTSKSSVNITSLLHGIVAKAILHSDIKIDSHVNEEILIDKNHLERIIWNLLKNADDALSESSDGHITITVTKQNNSILISVEDNGPGIPTEITENLFELGVTCHKQSGTGIGLYNCRKLAEAQGGRIWVESKIGSGSIFYIEIPQ